nr:zinc finger CCCH domain-containing protein 18-like isoform X1 [Ipomoea batatas]
MAVYFKFKSAKDYDSIPIDSHFIAVGNLKEKIFESKHLGRGTDFDLVVTNAQTNEEYLDEDTLIPKNTSVLIRRVPGRPRMPIVTAPITELEETVVENKFEEDQTVKVGFVGVETSAAKYPEDLEWDEFGTDLYATPEVMTVQSSNPVQEVSPPSKADEESKIKALIDTPALDWQSQSADGFGAGRGYGRGPGGRMMGGRGFGRGGFERKTPPPGYVCYRCKVAGHFIQHCPTNGDPNFDIKRVKPPTGIPKSMLMATPDGSYALPSGANAVLKPNEAAFEKAVEAMPSTRSVGELPPELHCPLCKEVMKDAVLTSKCCFKSFCDKCVRDYIISKTVCVCGATNILADDLLPNKTLRDTINRILESNNSSEHGGSALHVQDMESARNPMPKNPSPSQSAASRGEKVPQPLPQKEETSRVPETAGETSKADKISQPLPQKEETLRAPEKVEEVKLETAPLQLLEKGKMPKMGDISEPTHESFSLKEPASQGSALPVDEEVQQKPAAVAAADAAKKKKKKRPRMPIPASEMQWRPPMDLAAENYMMPMGPGYNPYWTGMQPGMEGFGGPFPAPMPYMNYGMEGFGGPFQAPFGHMMPQDPFGGQGCMLPFVPPQRDLANFGTGFDAGPPIMSREEFEARKSGLKRKHENERHGEREPKDGREFSREVGSSCEISSKKPKSNSQRPLPPPSSSDHHLRHRSERPSPDRRSRDPELPRPSKKKYDDYEDYHRRDRDYLDDRHRRREARDHHERERERDLDRHGRSKPSSTSARPAPAEPPTAASKESAADKKNKASVFSRISFPEGEAAAASKKHKSSSSSTEAPASGSLSQRGVPAVVEQHKASSGVRKSGAAGDDYESSDDERHFKRRPSRYESPPPRAEYEEEATARHSKGWRERERDRDREREHRSGYSNKHK